MGDEKIRLDYARPSDDPEPSPKGCIVTTVILVVVFIIIVVIFLYRLASTD